jgi:2-keto-4-pentenoate hydratase/2-oxohepta-3-ene-1,7-dioic acid hydratase in catechol pathway
MTLINPSTKKRLHVGKVLCIGRNYARHAVEMGSAVPKSPVVFLKPSTAIVRTQGTVVLPAMTSNVHHEVELVVVIGPGGRSIRESEALDHVMAYAVGLDMTARDLQSEAKKKGKPWSIAKGFDTFAPLGPLISADKISDPQALTLSLKVNGMVRQHGHTGDMIFTVAHLISYCSRVFTLEPGDLLYTGTPEGVGSVMSGDQLEAGCTGLPSLTVTVV